MTALQLGVVFPQTEIGADPAAIRDYVQTAEGLGYDYLMIYDHVLGANPQRPGGWKGPYTHESMFHEPFVLFGFLTGITRRIQFTTGILILPQRQTALVAKQAAEVDVLSGGRLRIGIGVGWNFVEYTALGEEFTNRGKRLEEQVHLLREFWTKPLVNRIGEYHTIQDAGINPLPIQRPIPIWFGGGADVVLRRIARLADGWMPNSMPMERLDGMLTTLRGYLRDEGRDPAAFPIDARLSVRNNPPDVWAKEAEQFRAFGVSHLCVNTMGAGYTSPQQHLDAIRQFKAVVQP